LLCFRVRLGAGGFPAGEVAGPRVGEAGASAWSPPAFFELGMGGAAEGGAGELVAVPGLGLGQAGGLDRFFRLS
jgi:hypothetical protein